MNKIILSLVLLLTTSCFNSKIVVEIEDLNDYKVNNNPVFIVGNKLSFKTKIINNKSYNEKVVDNAVKYYIYNNKTNIIKYNLQLRNPGLYKIYAKYGLQLSEPLLIDALDDASNKIVEFNSNEIHYYYNEVDELLYTSDILYIDENYVYIFETMYTHSENRGLDVITNIIFNNILPDNVKKYKYKITGFKIKYLSENGSEDLQNNFEGVFFKDKYIQIKKFRNIYNEEGGDSVGNRTDIETLNARIIKL